MHFTDSVAAFNTIIIHHNINIVHKHTTVDQSKGWWNQQNYSTCNMRKEANLVILITSWSVILDLAPQNVKYDRL